MATKGNLVFECEEMIDEGYVLSKNVQLLMALYKASMACYKNGLQPYCSVKSIGHQLGGEILRDAYALENIKKRARIDFNFQSGVIERDPTFDFTSTRVVLKLDNGRELPIQVFSQDYPGVENLRPGLKVHIWLREEDNQPYLRAEYATINLPENTRLEK